MSFILFPIYMHMVLPIWKRQSDVDAREPTEMTLEGKPSSSELISRTQKAAGRLAAEPIMMGDWLHGARKRKKV